MNENGIENERRYPDGPIRHIIARQCDKGIEVIAEFNLTKPIYLPSLGIIITNTEGYPIFGTNPVLSGVFPLEIPISSGIVHALFTEPKLCDAFYRASIWFGDGSSGGDVFSERDCVTFEVAGMNRDSVGLKSNGPVIPHCEFTFIKN